MYVVKNKVFLHMVKTAGISFHRGCNNAGHQLFFNQRHLAIECLPDRYRDLERFTIIRPPHEWYQSFYDFYLSVEGFMSFMLNDLGQDNFIHPIGVDEFVRRSINFKHTLQIYPNKARVFNNILQTQGQIHFIDSYFTAPPFGESADLDQFDMSLYEWFYTRAGCDTAVNVPIDCLDYLENIFGITMPHENKQKKKTERMSAATIELIKTTHKKYYDIIEDFKTDHEKDTE